MSGTSIAAATTYENLLVQVRDRVARVTINRPKVLNALNGETTRELRAAFAALRNDDSVGVVIVTGAGEKAFVAGADINELATMTPLQAEGVSRLGQATLREIETLGKPVIAAVNGFALGGGCELALACHWRYASENAKLGLPEVGLGIIPGYGGTQRLPRIVGLGRALEMIASARPVDAQEAHRIGLVNAVLPPAELLPHCERVAAEVLQRGPVAMRMAMDAALRGVEGGFAQGIEVEAIYFGLVSATADMNEGLRAFLEKRRPAFKGA
jgi:enoyl-CoA hydratase